MRILHFIPDDQSRSTLLAQARRKQLEAHEDGGWVVFGFFWPADPEAKWSLSEE